MYKVPVSHPRDRGFEPNTGYDHDSSYDTSTGWLISCKNLLYNRAKINKIKLHALITGTSLQLYQRLFLIRKLTERAEVLKLAIS